MTCPNCGGEMMCTNPPEGYDPNDEYWVCVGQGNVADCGYSEVRGTTEPYTHDELIGDSE
jgi:hypothetical protein